MKVACGRTDSRVAVDWRVAAILMLVGSAGLLWRTEPLAWWWPLAGLPLCAILGRWRLTAGLVLLLLSWMAWSYAQGWHQRLAGGAELSLTGQVEGPVTRSGQSQRFALVPENRDIGRLRVSWYRSAFELRAGQCLRLQLRTRAPRGSVNPGGLDYEAWLFRQGYAGRASVRAARPCGPAPPADWRLGTVQRWRALGSERAVASAAALLLGWREGMQAVDWSSLRRTGTTHLFAISGLHLGLIAASAYALGLLLWRGLLWRWLPRARTPAALLAAAAALGYAAISGFGVPVQRALIMALLGLFLLVAGRRRPATSVLGLAAVVVVAGNPLVLLGPGFWLSFAAVLVILVYLRRHPDRRPLRQLLGLQLWLSLFLAPLAWLHFGGIAWLSLPINLLLVPLFGLYLPALMVAGLLELGLGFAPALSALLRLTDGVWWLLDAAADWPAAYSQLPTPGLPTVAVALSGLLWLLWRADGWRWLGFMLLLPLSLAGDSRPAQGQFRVWFWDVGQGQSVLVQTAGHDLLYDAGPAWKGGFDAGERIVVPALRAIGVRQLSALLISHDDTDHAGGAAAVQAAYAIPPAECRQGRQWVWDDVEFAILHPDGGGWDDNNGSCVLRVTASDGRRLLLTGDIEASAERHLLSRAMELRADLVSVPHHGSASSSSPAFLAAVAPQLAVVSAGWRNRWGFPRADVLARHAGRGVTVLNTATAGAVQVDVGPQLRVQSWRSRHPRLWRYPASKP